MNKGIVDLGKSERHLGSTFVQLSRFKKLTDFLIKPFPYSRLQMIAKSEALLSRTKEEKRLDYLNKQTKLKYQFI